MLQPATTRCAWPSNNENLNPDPQNPSCPQVCEAVASVLRSLAGHGGSAGPPPAPLPLQQHTLGCALAAVRALPQPQQVQAGRGRPFW